MAAKKKAGANIDTLSEAPVYLLFGGDEFQVSENCRRLVDRLCPPDQQAFGLEIIEPQGDTVADGMQSLSNTLAGLQTIGLFGGEKVVWLRDAAFLSVQRTMKSEDMKAALDRFVQELKKGFGDGTVLVISARGLDKRSAFYKACGAAGHAVEYAVPDKGYHQERVAKEVLGGLLGKRGLRANAAVLDRFIGKAGTDTRQLAQEVEKVGLYIGDRKQVTEQDILDIVSPAREAMSWDLEDAMGMRKPSDAMQVLSQLLFQGEHPVGIVIRLESRYRDLMTFFGCIARKWCSVQERQNGVNLVWRDLPEAEEALSKLPADPRKMHPFRAGRLASQALNYSGAELMDAHDLLQKAHEDLVSTSLPNALVLEFLVLRLVGKNKGR